jgi:hypothetical protein
VAEEILNTCFFVHQGQVIRMMGALPEEITEVSLPSTKRVEDRILGFAEEDYRAKQRATLGAGHSRQLPQGPYVFSQFQTLQLPNVEVNGVSQVFPYCTILWFVGFFFQ